MGFTHTGFIAPFCTQQTALQLDPLSIVGDSNTPNSLQLVTLPPLWSMVGGQTTEQGDCSKFKGNIPHCCKKDPTVVDLLPGTPYNQQIANCCKGGVINSWVQDPSNAASSFQISVSGAGTTNKTVRVPKTLTLKAPGPENSYLLCFTLILLQQHNCTLPDMHLWLSKQQYSAASSTAYGVERIS
ncbi:hypothetical protein CsSME_00030598 [Camellia sinensis var. sinensis]